MAADVDVVPYLAIGQHQTNMYWAVGGLGHKPFLLQFVAAPDQSVSALPHVDSNIVL